MDFGKRQLIAVMYYVVQKNFNDNNGLHVFLFKIFSWHLLFIFQLLCVSLLLALYILFNLPAS